MYRASNNPDPREGCVYCIYEGRQRTDGPCSVVAQATQLVNTPRGPRHLCGAHATAGTWAGAA